jgi:hypothetical protein
MERQEMKKKVGNLLCKLKDDDTNNVYVRDIFFGLVGLALTIFLCILIAVCICVLAILILGAVGHIISSLIYQHTIPIELFPFTIPNVVFGIISITILCLICGGLGFIWDYKVFTCMDNVIYDTKYDEDKLLLIKEQYKMFHNIELEGKSVIYKDFHDAYKFYNNEVDKLKV